MYNNRNFKCGSDTRSRPWPYFINNCLINIGSINKCLINYWMFIGFIGLTGNITIIGKYIPAIQRTAWYNISITISRNYRKSRSTTNLCLLIQYKRLRRYRNMYKEIITYTSAAGTRSRCYLIGKILRLIGCIG